MNTRWISLTLLLVTLLGCGHEVRPPDDGKLPEAADDNIELEDTAIAFLMPSGKWRMVLVNRENSTYLRNTKSEDDVYHSPKRFDKHLRNYHSYCDQKIILNRDMQALVDFMKGAGFYDHAIEFDEDELLLGRWGGGEALVLQQGASLYRLSKKPGGDGQMGQADFSRRKCYVDIKTHMLWMSRRYRHYEVKNTSAKQLQPKAPLVKPKFKGQLKNKEER